MKLKTVVAVLVAVTTLTIGSAFAQSMARVDIPFAFSIGNTELPPGEYTVGPISPENNNVLVIHSLNGHQEIFVQTSVAESTNSPDRNKLVFRRYGDRYFLSQIWVEAVGHSLPISNREREMARRTSVEEASLLGK